MVENRRLAYSSGEIAVAVSRLAEEISATYAGEELILVVVLKGAIFFAADLARSLKVPIRLEFLKASSYEGMETSGSVTISDDLKLDVAGRNLLVVEDVVDTGLTLTVLLQRLQHQSPKSLKVCALLNKRGRRRVALEPDFVGIECGDRFLIGYGLDLDERYRELADIYELDT
jgi:hypoxanthine phosphoribosyltransferase